MNEIIETPGTTLAVEPMSVAITPMAMIAQAVANGASIDMVERLMALHERMEKKEAEKAFVAAMAEFKALAITIMKNKHVSFGEGQKKTEYDHSTLDTIIDAVVPELSKFGLSHRWKTEQLDGGLVRVTCIVRHRLGYAEETPLQAGLDQTGGKNNIQALGSTVSYLERYTLLAALGLATKGQGSDDGRDSESSTISMDQVAQLQDGLAKASADIAAFCRYFKINALVEMQQKDVGRAWEMIHAKRAAAEKAGSGKNPTKTDGGLL